MNSSSKLLLLALSLLLSAGALTLLSACEEYEPPPNASLQRSGEGSYEAGAPLTLNFSQPIVADSLSLSVWPASRGTRRVPEADVEPIIPPCAAASCDGIDVDIASNGSRATLTLDPELIGPGSNIVLEILPGLRDRAGNTTGASYLYTIRFRAGGGEELVDFEDGIFILGGAVNQPLRAVLTLVADIKVLPDGRFVLAGARGLVEDGADEMTRNPDEITVDDGDVSWALFATGTVTQNADGQRFLETDVFDVAIPVLGGSLFLYMFDVRISGEFIQDGDGNEALDSILSYESLTIYTVATDVAIDYDGDSTELLGDFVPPDRVPEGAPDLCGNLCGNAVNGVCAPPADFPHPDFCTTD